MMEPRRISRSGSTSNTIALPIQWVRRHGLRSKDVVYIESDGEDLVVRCTSRASTRDVADILVHDHDDLSLRELVWRHYQRGATQLAFIIHDARDAQTVTRCMEQCPGFEMDDLQGNRMVYRDFFAAETIRPTEILRKQVLALRALMRDAQERGRDRHATQQYAASAQRQALLLRRQLFRKPGLSQEEVRLLLACIALQKTAGIWKEFVAAIDALGDDDRMPSCDALLQEYRVCFDNVTDACLRGDAAVASTLAFIERIERLKNVLRQTDDGAFALVLQHMISLYHEAIRITECTLLAADRT